MKEEDYMLCDVKVTIEIIIKEIDDLKEISHLLLMTSSIMY